MMEETDSIVLKCASCYQSLKDPVQLVACFHIVCFDCKQKLENDNGPNFTCPQCRKENIRELKSGTDLVCEFLENHVARSFCFDCGKIMCGTCISTHTEVHNTIRYSAEETDSVNQENIQCPICKEATCKHRKLLHDLKAGLRNCNCYCQQQGHVDVNNKPLELKFFCLQCWTPICGDCSKSKHKDIPHEKHKTDDMSDCGKEFVGKSLEVLHEKLEMLIRTSHRDVIEAKGTEYQLERHVADMDKELNSRRSCGIFKETDEFKKAISDSVLQGHSLLTDYKEPMNKIEHFHSFFKQIEDALSNIKMDFKQAEIKQYIGAFHLQKCAEKLIEDLDEEYRKFPQPVERRLVLPEMDSTLLVQGKMPLHLVQVKSEMRQLKLAFSFALKLDNFWEATSIVLTDKDKCLISYKKSGVTDFDGIAFYHYKGSKDVVFKEYEVERGTYFLSRLQSGEIIASFARNNKFSKKCKNKVLFFNGSLPSGTKLSFDEVTTLQFPPCGIATTKDNNIVLCVINSEHSSEEKEEYLDKNFYHVVYMSSHGKILKSSIEQLGINLTKPDYVAVSDSGEICISDKGSSNIVILNEDLTIKQRMNYQLPTSMRDIADYKFHPHGVCYDTFGRIIVADPDNNSVVRLTRNSQSKKYILEPLLSEEFVEAKNVKGEFIGPRLVALSKDSKLWVVCISSVFVFDYCV